MTPDFPCCPPRALTPHGLAQEIEALRSVRQALLDEPHTASVMLLVGYIGTTTLNHRAVWLPARALASLMAARIAGLEAYLLSVENAAAGDGGAAGSNPESAR